jgi:hypothetical protein
MAGEAIEAEEGENEAASSRVILVPIVEESKEGDKNVEQDTPAAFSRTILETIAEEEEDEIEESANLAASSQENAEIKDSSARMMAIDTPPMESTHSFQVAVVALAPIHAVPQAQASPIHVPVAAPLLPSAPTPSLHILAPPQLVLSVAGISPAAHLLLQSHSSYIDPVDVAWMAIKERCDRSPQQDLTYDWPSQVKLGRG